MVRFPALSILLKNLGKAHFYAKTAMYFGTHSFFFFGLKMFYLKHFQIHMDYRKERDNPQVQIPYTQQSSKIFKQLLLMVSVWILLVNS